MNTFEQVEKSLTSLELKHFRRLRSSFSWTAEMKSCISGSAQFFAIDPLHRGEDQMPVICAVGINYFSEKMRGTEGLAHFLKPNASSVVDRGLTGCRTAVNRILAAYNRNQKNWTSREATDPRSPLGYYGSASATPRSLSDDNEDGIGGRFILVMTNVTPYITQMQWAKQVQKKEAELACRRLISSNSTEHLDDLLLTLGDSIDLWIGHSSIYNTEWVWPMFSHFVQEHGIPRWLLSTNISSLGARNLDGCFRSRLKTGEYHRLFPWYGPEKGMTRPTLALT